MRLLDRNEEALEAVNRALALIPGNVKGLGLKGLILKEMGRTEEAVDALQRSVYLDPTSTLVLT